MPSNGYVRPGETIRAVKGSDVSGGDMLIIGSGTLRRAGHIMEDTVAGDTIVAMPDGVYELTKASGDAFAREDPVYWDDTAKEATVDAAAGANKFIGHAEIAAVAADPRVTVHLLDTVS